MDFFTAYLKKVNGLFMPFPPFLVTFLFQIRAGYSIIKKQEAGIMYADCGL